MVIFRRNARATKTKTLFLLCPFRRNFAKFLVMIRQQGLSFTELHVKKFPFGYLCEEHKSIKSVGERSILAVRIAKFGLLREPIRILLFAMDQFSHITMLSSTQVNSVLRGFDWLLNLGIKFAIHL